MKVAALPFSSVRMLPVIHDFWLGYVRTVTVGTTSAMNLLIKPVTDVVYSSMSSEESQNMFRDSSNDIEENTTSVTGFINKCIEDIVHSVTVHTYPIQKPWITGNIRTELKGRAAAFKVRDSYKKSCYALRRTIKQAKHQYRAKIESYYTGSDTSSDARRMWQGLQTITDYKGKHSRELHSDTSLPDELNHFYARFEVSNTEACMRASAVPDDCVITLSVPDVNKTFKQVNIHKATGPDGFPRRLLLTCADPLASVFTDIFNPSPRL